MPRTKKDWAEVERGADLRWLGKKYGLTKEEAEVFLSLDEARRKHIESEHGRWTLEHGLSSSSPLSRGAFVDRMKGRFR